MDLNPQQEAFLSYYTNPNSDTFGNALQSALKANYSQEYSESITAKMPDWLAENVGDMKRLKKAEKVLDRTLELDAINEEGKVDTQVLKIQTDVAKFVGSTIGKSKYSTRQELTGKDGGSIEINIVKYEDNNTI